MTHAFFFLLLKPKFLLARVMMKHFERHSSGKMNVTNLEGQFVTPQNSNRARRTQNLSVKKHMLLSIVVFFFVPFVVVAANTAERYWESLLACKMQKCTHLRRQSDSSQLIHTLSFEYHKHIQFQRVYHFIRYTCSTFWAFA